MTVIRHGHSAGGRCTPEYYAWQSMISRCERPKNKQWKDYGGRGIRVCRRWRRSFESFLADMGLRPSADHSLDRVDVNGHYTPRNCKWSTRQEQTRNVRAVVRYPFRGAMLTLAELAEHPSCRVNKGSLWFRLRKTTWSVELAVTTPAEHGRNQTWQG